LGCLNIFNASHLGLIYQNKYESFLTLLLKTRTPTETLLELYGIDKNLITKQKKKSQK